MVDEAEVSAAIAETARHKKKRRVVRWALEHQEELAHKTAQCLIDGTWKPPFHPSFAIREGAHRKQRDIVKPRWNNEQIVHHLLMRQFQKILLPRIYHYACGTIIARGPHFAMQTMKRWRDEYKGQRFYVAEMDVRKFYANIDQTILKRQLRRVIRDKQYLHVLFQVIDGHPSGLPLGYYTSPFLGMFYLLDFDNYVVQQLRPDHYLRFMDNLWIFGRNKKELHRKMRAMMDYLACELHLTIKDDWQVFRFEGERGFREPKETEDDTRGRRKKKHPRGRAINALGFVIHRDRITIRKSILKRIRAKANHVKRRGRCTVHDAAAILSQLGWLRWADAYQYFQDWIKPNVSIRYCRRRVSRAAKTRDRERKKDHDKLADGT